MLLVSPKLRPWIARFVRQAVPNLTVLAYTEIPENRRIRVVAAVGSDVTETQTPGSRRSLNHGVLHEDQTLLRSRRCARRIAQVRAEHGPDAVILSSKRVEGGIEIIAAIDYDEALIAAGARHVHAAGSARLHTLTRRRVRLRARRQLPPSRSQSRRARVESRILRHAPRSNARKGAASARRGPDCGRCAASVASSLQVPKWRHTRRRPRARADQRPRPMCPPFSPILRCPACSGRSNPCSNSSNRSSRASPGAT